MKESTILAKIVATVTKEFPEAWVRKIADRFTRGLPDLVICYQRQRLVPILGIPGKQLFDTRPEFATLFVEVKRPNGVESKIQELERSRIAKLGGNWIVATSPQEVINFMRC